MDRSRLAKFIDQRVGELPLANPVFLPPTATVRTAVQRMHTGARSCVLAVEDDHRLVGIFTERDVLTRCMGADFDWDQPLDQGVLTRKPATIAAETTVGDAIALMQRHNYRTLPVIEDGAVVGLVRLGELLQHFVESFPEEVLNLPPRPHQVVAKREGG